MPRSKEEKLKEYINLTLFTPTFITRGVGGQDIYNFLDLYLQLLHTKYGN